MDSKKFKNLFEFLKTNPTEKKCIKYFEQIRWKGNPTSPFDPTSKVYKLADGKYKCKNTNRRFTVITKSIFSSTKLPLKTWFKAICIFSSHKKSISSHQLARELDITQTTAWYLLHRLRFASNLSLFKVMLKGSVEIDEMYLGGSNTNRHWDKKTPKAQGRNWKDKTPIWGAVERDSGNIVAQVVRDVRRRTLEPIIKDNIEKGSNIYSDEYPIYNGLSRWYNHQIVIHRKKQYKNGNASTNAIENRWSHFNRIVYGIHHWISRKHVQKYLDEFVFRNNTRKYSKEERGNLLLLSTVNKHLTCRKLTF